MRLDRHRLRNLISKSISREARSRVIREAISKRGLEEAASAADPGDWPVSYEDDDADDVDEIADMLRKGDLDDNLVLAISSWFADDEDQARRFLNNIIEMGLDAALEASNVARGDTEYEIRRALEFQIGGPTDPDEYYDMSEWEEQDLPLESETAHHYEIEEGDVRLTGELADIAWLGEDDLEELEDILWLGEDQFRGVEPSDVGEDPRAGEGGPEVPGEEEEVTESWTSSTFSRDDIRNFFRGEYVDNEANNNLLTEGPVDLEPDTDADDAAELRDIAADLEDEGDVEHAVTFKRGSEDDPMYAPESADEWVRLTASDGEEIKLPTTMSGLETGWAVIGNPYYRFPPGHELHEPEWRAKDGDTVIGVDRGTPGGMPVADAYQELWAEFDKIHQELVLDPMYHDWEAERDIVSAEASAERAELERMREPESEFEHLPSQEPMKSRGWHQQRGLRRMRETFTRDDIKGFFLEIVKGVE